MKDGLKIAVRVILPVWLVVKLIAAAVTMFTVGEVDLTFLNPAAELAFQSLVFVKSTSLGLTIFIGFVVILTIGYPAGFLVVPDSRVQNIIGFFAYAAVTLTDIISALVMGFSDPLFFLSLAVDLLILFCLLCYGKWVILGDKSADPADVSHTEEPENNA